MHKAFLLTTLFLSSSLHGLESYPALPTSGDQLTAFMQAYLQAVPSCIILIDIAGKAIQMQWTGGSPANNTYRQTYHNNLLQQINIFFRNFSTQQIRDFYTALKTSYPHQVVRLEPGEIRLPETKDDLNVFINQYLRLNRFCTMYIDPSDTTIQIQWSNNPNGFLHQTLYQALVLQRVNRIFRLFTRAEANAFLQRLQAQNPTQIFTPEEGTIRFLTRDTVLPTDPNNYDRSQNINILYLGLTDEEQTAVKTALRALQAH